MKWIKCAVWLSSFFFLGAATVKAELRIGIGTEIITPPLGIGLAGYYHERGNQGVLDDILAKATVLDDGNSRAAIVVCDLITIPRWLVVEAREIIAQQTGIASENVLIAATHTHTAPVLYRESERDLVDGAAKTNALEYSRSLPGKIAAAVRKASENKRPVNVFVAKEYEDQLAYNRRFWMRDSSVGWNPGRKNPNILRPAGPIDPEVGVFYAETSGTNRTPVLTFVNYALHPDSTSGSKISADYPGALSRILALFRGNEMLTLFGNSTCGNINHIDIEWKEQVSSPQEANRLGTILAASVFKAYPRLQRLTNSLTLTCKTEMVSLPIAPFTPEELEQARKDAATAKDNTRDGFMRLVRAHRILDNAARQGKPYEVEMQVIALGTDVVWVSWPGEIFVELGLSAKAGSPFKNVYHVELANGSIGYIPNKPAFLEGNYEVESSRVAAGSGEMLVSAALRLMEAAHRQTGSK
jgi:hypothetical protein